MQRPPGLHQDQYVPALDGLRAVSIALVLLAHLGLDRVVPGGFGVTLFFFISGYLITRQLAAGLGRTGRIGFGGFYARRVLRLLPAGLTYIVLAGACFSLAGGRITPAGWVSALLYGANFYDVWGGYRSTLEGVRHPFNILWSLAIEEQFYLVWPAVLAVLWWRRWALGAVLGLCAAVLLWRVALLDMCFGGAAPWLCGPPNPSAQWQYNRLYMATDARLDSIAWGAALALLEVRGRVPPRWAVWPGALLLAVSFVGAAPWARHVVRPSLQGVGLVLVFPVLLAGVGPVARALAARPALFVGRLSYSLYLWHWAALAVADAVAVRFGLVWEAVAVTLSGGLALGSYYGIERPMLRVRRRFGSAVRLESAGWGVPPPPDPPSLL